MFNYALKRVGWMAVVVAPFFSAPATAVELHEFLQLCDVREQMANEGIDWKWSGEQGRTKGLPNFQSETIAWSGPIDRYEFHWISANDTYLYSRIAQQPRRLIAKNDQTRVAELSIRSEVYLTNGRSRLTYYPPPVGANGLPSTKKTWCGIIEGAEGGLSEDWGPGAVPLHAGLFGMGRPQFFLENPTRKAQTGVSEGASDLGVPCTVVSSGGTGGFEERFYLSDDDKYPVQYEQLSQGKLVHKTVVRKTVRAREGDRELMVPEAITTAIALESDEWMVFTVKTSAVTLRAAAADELVISFPETACHWAVKPFGNLTASDAKMVSAASLDRFVSDLFSSYRTSIAIQEQQRLTRGVVPQNRSSIWYLLIALNVAALFVAAIVLFRRSRRKGPVGGPGPA